MRCDGPQDHNAGEMTLIILPWERQGQEGEIRRWTAHLDSSPGNYFGEDVSTVRASGAKGLDKLTIYLT